MQRPGVEYLLTGQERTDAARQRFDVVEVAIIAGWSFTATLPLPISIGRRPKPFC